MHIEQSLGRWQSLGSVGKAEEESFEIRVKDCLGEGIADMMGRELQMEGAATVNDRWPKTRFVPGTICFLLGISQTRYSTLHSVNTQYLV